MIAQDAKYHLKCLVSLYNKTEAIHDRNNQQSMEDFNHLIALAELLAYIDESRKDDDIRVFKLADLSKLYSTRLQQLGVEQYDHVHRTRLKNHILVHFPDLAAHKEGYDVLLAFNKDLGAALVCRWIKTMMMRRFVLQGLPTSYGKTCSNGKHEQTMSPSLSQLGKLRLGAKSDIFHCLESIIELDSTVSGPDTDVTILDGAVVVNFLKPLEVKTFEEYALKVFLPYVEH